MHRVFIKTKCAHHRDPTVPDSDDEPPAVSTGVTHFGPGVLEQHVAPVSTAANTQAMHTGDENADTDAVQAAGHAPNT